MVIRKSGALSSLTETVAKSPSIERQGVASLWAWSTTLRQVVSVIVLASALLALHSLLSAITTNAGYQLVEQKLAVVRISQELEQLQLEVDMKNSPGRIQAEAAKRLGMIEPNMVIYSSANTKGTHPTRDTANKVIRD